MTKLRIACVGAGSVVGARSSGFMEVIKQLHDLYDFTAVMDLREANAQAAAAAYGVPEVYTTLDDLFAKGKPEVIVRLTPTDSTFAVCMRAAEAGVHILNEIPIATTMAQARLLMQTCQRQRVIMEVAENTWTWPRERLKQEIVRRGLIGEVTHLRLQYPCGAYHGFSAIRKLVGAEAERVLGWQGRVPVVNMISYGGEAMAETFWDGGLIKFPGHVQCLFEMPPKRPVWRHAWDVEGTQGFIGAVAGAVDGAKGHRYGEALVLDDPKILQQLTDDVGAAGARERHYPIEWVYGDRGGQRVLECVKVATSPEIVWENPYARYGISDDDAISKATYLESIHRALVDGRPLVYGPENAARDMELWIAIRESAWRGNTWVTLPLAETTGVEEALHAEYARRYGCDPLGDIDRQLAVVYDRTPVMWTVCGWL
jgi:hypothetical protein